MISEYHINLLLEKLGAVIKNQNKIIELLSGGRELKVCAPQETLDIHVSDPLQKEGAGRVKSTAAFKLEYQKYKAEGGKLGWNAWLKEGRPAGNSK